MKQIHELFFNPGNGKKQMDPMLVCIVCLVCFIYLPLCTPISAQERVTIPVSKESDTFRDLKLYQDPPLFLGMKTVSVNERTKSRDLDFNGTLDYNKDAYYQISVRHASMVKEVKRTIGDAVQKDDILMHVESFELAALQQDFIDAQVLRGNAQQNMRYNRDSIFVIEQQIQTIKHTQQIITNKIQDAEHTRERVLLQYENRRTQTELAHQQLVNAQDSFATLSLDFARAAKLYEQRIISQEEYFRAERDKLQGQQQIFSIQQQILRHQNQEEALQKELITISQSIKQFQQEQSTLDVQKYALQAQITEMTRSFHEHQSDLLIHDTHLSRAATSLQVYGFEKLDRLFQNRNIDPNISIKSPIAGMVINRFANVGERIDPSRPIYTIANLSTLWLYLDVYEVDFTPELLHKEVEVTVTNYPNTTFTGKVTYLNAEVDSESRTIQVRAEIENIENKLVPGMYTHATIHLPSEEKGLFIPSDAAVPLGSRFLVFRQKEENQFEPLILDLGPEFNNEREVLSTLKEGDQVVSDAVFLLDSETQLRGIISDLDTLIQY